MLVARDDEDKEGGIHECISGGMLSCCLDEGVPFWQDLGFSLICVASDFGFGTSVMAWDVFSTVRSPDFGVTILLSALAGADATEIFRFSVSQSSDSVKSTTTVARLERS